MTWEQFKGSKRVATVAARLLVTKTGRHEMKLAGPARTGAQQALVRRDPRPP
jgi:hypothetical protein